MSDVNWWLMALAFVLGVLLTLAFMIRRVTREVPIYAPLGRGPKGDVGAPTVDTSGASEASGASGAKAAGLAAGAGAGVAGAAAAAKATGGTGDVEIADEAPFGAGSVRLASGSATGPSGYTIKGNEDSMLYHTTESPSYEQTVAEVWFQKVEDAERAGFQRWDIRSQGNK
ncbi:channel accessory protein ArfC, sunset domain variant [Mycolicibacterium confluentis]|uniref:Putative membrane protein ArfC n=1 Tax=Mycolicibacterium confluentis TaxID=28047 RepID=A0A7I7XSB3_9MYCO|nr:hypothetical protein [Mycolicibacterium confluentis]MCV7318665.1 hypothetical protein [Mycolicibacterium confluentis]ORV23203.1 hypothetical protein AWB99_25210 [Mycolicibacterium confluentis]BBZ31812.1 putative membrane protein ArfC [Mycolicibacterium confluentis]